MTTAHPELLAPAGNWECARAAVANGADAVYFGLPQFNARMRADNFTLEELPRLMEFLHTHRVKGFVTMNTLIFTRELPAAEQFLRALQAARVDAIIVQDLGLVQLARAVAPDVEVHASTQMTITSPEGSRFAARLGATRVVLARETSLREMEKLHAPDLPPTEVFVHGALCVAYSGQCLTSESLGQRSANRGECAQACRLPYELIVDGALRDLGSQRYLLSPQDLAAVAEIPQLIERGVSSFKIEGRLKAPEYVAAVCQVYRKAINAALGLTNEPISAEDRYKLEMTFSRGLFSGWMHGVDHQQLVPAHSSNKRGPQVGTIKNVGTDWVEFGRVETPLRLGDGLLFDDGGDQNRQQGGRLYEIKQGRYYFQHGKIDFNRIKVGHTVYKTDDPQLAGALRKSFTRELTPPKETLDFTVSGKSGEPLQISAGGLTVRSTILLQSAQNRPLTDETLREQLGRLGDTPYTLGVITNQLEGEVMLPIKELNQLRRDLIERLSRPAPAQATPCESVIRVSDLLPSLIKSPLTTPHLIPLCRSLDQLRILLESGVRELYVDFEDLRRYKEAVILTRRFPTAQIFLATPRIQKASEQGFFKLIEAAEPDGVLVRNLGAIDYFKNSTLRRIGDFSLNVANPLTAQILLNENLERLTISYDLNADQVLDLLQYGQPGKLEIVLHQHMPMFHMEHCVFAAFLSEGKDHLTCGRPCDRHEIKLRDRVGLEHPVMADVGCRNTVFHGKAQSGALYFEKFRQAGVHHYRIEFLRETADQTQKIWQSYQSLLQGQTLGSALVQELKVASQLGVTSGTLTVLV